MPVFSKNPLPSINRFLAGLVTNRNPVDTPFSVMGLNFIHHNDALIDGLNTEVTAYNTLSRRPGFNLIIGPFGATVRDVFNYKDLEGNLSLFYDVNGTLYNGVTPVSGTSSGSAIWTIVAAGNFLYAANGVNTVRIDNDNLNAAVPAGLGPIQQAPTVQITTSNVPYFLTSFIPTGDIIGGLVVITDGNNSRILTIKINNGTLHFNVTYSGNEISENDQYTEVVAQTQTGTAPNTTTTQNISVTSGLTGTATGTGITNGIVAFYPSNGISTLDFDYAFTGAMTMSQLSTIVNAVAPSISAPNIPSTATSLLTVFVNMILVAGMVASGQYPDTAAQALAIQYNGK